MSASALPGTAGRRTSRRVSTGGGAVRASASFRRNRSFTGCPCHKDKIHHCSPSCKDNAKRHGCVRAEVFESAHEVLLRPHVTGLPPDRYLIEHFRPAHLVETG